MNFLGLLLKYPGNRPLSDEEVGRQLKQKIRLNKTPHYQLSVIEMNSTYLESVDKWFGWKGFVTFLTLAFFCVLVIGISMTTFEMAKPGFSASQVSSEDRAFYIGNGVAIFLLVVLPVAIGLLWLLRKDSFAYTHYPLRFNRKTRTVHVFRPNGTVLSVPWDEVFLRWDKCLHGTNGRFGGTLWSPIG